MVNRADATWAKAEVSGGEGTAAAAATAHPGNNIVHVLGLKELPRPHVDRAAVDCNATRQQELVSVVVGSWVSCDSGGKAS